MKKMFSSEGVISSQKKRLSFLFTFIVMIFFVIYGLFLVVTTFFVKDYVYYKNTTASNLLLAINPKLPYGNLLKARNQLYCEHKFKGLDECYVIVIVTSNPELVIAGRSSLDKLVIDFMKKSELEANKIRQPSFTVSRVKFTYNNQDLFEINLK